MIYNDYISIDDALRMLGVSRPTLYRWLRDGTLKGYRVGRQWRFSAHELKQFVRGEAREDRLAADLRDAIAFFEARQKRRSQP
ncbi:MAG: helix-turn-helix domain-containing protein [Armatimonadetes bacterium]|nr:helix-turn-helix domain-containing protein [Armatimonadota bacterium]